MSDLNLLITEYLEDIDALQFLEIKNPLAIFKYKYKGIIKWSEIKKNLPIYKVQNLIYDSPLPIKKLPDTVTSLTLYDLYEDELQNLPPKLYSLNTGSNFNGSIRGLPDTLKILKLGDKFVFGTKDIETEEDSGDDFDERDLDEEDLRDSKILALIVKGIKKPIRRKNNEYNIEKIAPQIKELHLHNWDPKVLNIYSTNLDTLVVTHISSCHCCIGMPTYIPPNIKILKIYGYTQKSLIFDNALEELEIVTDKYPIPEKYPTNLKILSLWFYFNKPLINLPNLHTLKLGDSYNFSFESLPNTLTYLEIGNTFNLPLLNLPKNLKYLKLGNAFNQNFNTPESLETIILGNSFNLPLTLSNLKQLKYLSIGNSFNKNIEFPNNLETLILGKNFNQHLPTLPGLKYLTLGLLFESDINTFPDSLIKLSFLNHADTVNNIITNNADRFPEFAIFSRKFNHTEIIEFSKFKHLSNLQYLQIDAGTKMHNTIFECSNSPLILDTVNTMMNSVIKNCKLDKNDIQITQTFKMGLELAKLFSK